MTITSNISISTALRHKAVGIARISKENAVIFKLPNVNNDQPMVGRMSEYEKSPLKDSIEVIAVIDAKGNFVS